MPVDSDMQVWLDTVNREQPAAVIPYVLSETSRELQFRLRAVSEGDGSRAIIGQSGALRVPADVPTALGRLSMTTRPGQVCQIEVVLTGRGIAERRYVFECPS